MVRSALQAAHRASEGGTGMVYKASPAAVLPRGSLLRVLCNTFALRNAAYVLHSTVCCYLGWWLRG